MHVLRNEFSPGQEWLVACRPQVAADLIQAQADVQPPLFFVVRASCRLAGTLLLARSRRLRLASLLLGLLAVT